VQIIRAGWPRVATLCRELNLRADLVPDAYLAALEFEERAELVTFDRGFGVTRGCAGVACSTG